MSEETKKILKLIKKIHTQLLALSHECGNVKWMAPEYDKHFGDFSTKFINKEFSEFEKKGITMSEETKKMLYLIFNLFLETRLSSIGRLRTEIVELVRKRTIEEIQREFPEFEPRELSVYKEIEPISL